MRRTRTELGLNGLKTEEERPADGGGGMRKSVSFDSLQRVVLVPSAKEMPPDEKRQSWCVGQRFHVVRRK